MTRDQEQADRPAVAEANQSMLHDPLRRLIGYRTGTYKLIYAPENADVPAELYDLRADPGEVHNLAAERPELVTELRQRVEHGHGPGGLDSPNGRGSGSAGGTDGGEQRMSAEEEQVIRDRLEQLGYIE
jgi:arylsulfatase A-like enzyme